MAYRLTLADGSVEAALRRIAAEQLDAALANAEMAMAEAGGADLQRGVHAIRVAIKRTRALIRLVRAAFPEFAPTNAALRTLARDLSGLRETGVMLATFDDVARGMETGGKALAEFRTVLLAEEVAASSRARDADEMPRARERLLALRADCEEWQLQREGFGALRKGLKRTCRAAVVQRDEAANGDPEAFHEWRKHIKDHGFHVRLLRDIDPALSARSGMLGRLGDLLGAQHDLCMLEARVAAAKGKALRRLEAAAADRRRALETEALLLGAVLFEEPCKARVRRWEAAWQRAREDA